MFLSLAAPATAEPASDQECAAHLSADGTPSAPYYECVNRNDQAEDLAHGFDDVARALPQGTVEVIPASDTDLPIGSIDYGANAPADTETTYRVVTDGYFAGPNGPASASVQSLNYYTISC